MAARRRQHPHAPLWATLIATFFGIGRLHPGPGTWGSAATVLLWAAAAYALQPSLRTPVAIALAAVRHADRHPRRHPRCPRLRRQKIPSSSSSTRSPDN